MESLEHQIRKTLKYADEFVRICLEQGKTVTFLDLLVRPVWRFGALICFAWVSSTAGRVSPSRG